MSNFILRDIEPSLWERLKRAAAMRGKGVKAFVFEAILANIETVEADASL